MIQKYQLPITCSHTPIYDNIRGEMVCTSCGEVLIEREQMPYVNYPPSTNLTKTELTGLCYPKNTQGESAKIQFDKTRKLIKRYEIFMDTSILTISIRKIRLFGKFFDVTDPMIDDLIYYYKKIPKNLICKKFVKGVEQYRCYEFLFVLFYYQTAIKHVSLEEYLDFIANEGFILQMYRFNKIAIVLKQHAPELIKKIIVLTQFQRSRMINRRILKTLHEIVDKVDYTHIKTSRNIIPIMMHEIAIDTNKSEIENWRDYLLKKSNEIMDKVNFSNVKMHLNSICSGLIYVACHGTMTKKNISSLCQLSELTVSLSTNKVENFLRKKCPNML